MVSHFFPFRTIFWIFGLGLDKNSKKHRILFNFLHLFQWFIILHLNINIWRFKNQLFSSFDTWTNLSDNIQYFSILIVDLTVLLESIFMQKWIQNLILMINKSWMEKNFGASRILFRKFELKFSKVFVIFMVTLATTETSYLLCNIGNTALSKLIVYNFYLFFFKHLREFQFIFHICLVKVFLEIIEIEVKNLVESNQTVILYEFRNYKRISKNHLKRSYKLYFFVTKYLTKTMKIFRWSMVMIILQNNVQLLTEFYWIAFGLINISAKEKLDDYEVWPLIPCLLPKVCLPLYLWDLLNDISVLEYKIFNRLNSILLRNCNEKDVFMVSICSVART